MNKTTYLIFIILFTPIVAIAQQIQGHIESQELGLSLDIPSGWVGQYTDGGVLLGHPSITGLLLLTGNNAKSNQQLKNLAMEGFADGGVQLTPVDDFKIIGNNRVEGFYQGYFNGAEVKAYAVGLINHLGNGLNAIIMTETTKFTQLHQRQVNELARSVKFFQSKDTYATKNWKNKITGKQLKYFNTSTMSDGSGISDRINIDLCNNGHFVYYSNSHASFDGSGGYGSANSRNNSQGSYKVKSLGSQSYLQLNFDNGEVYEYELSTNERQNTFLDGSRYLIADLENCY